MFFKKKVDSTSTKEKNSLARRVRSTTKIKDIHRICPMIILRDEGKTNGW